MGILCVEGCGGVHMLAWVTPDEPVRDFDFRRSCWSWLPIPQFFYFPSQVSLMQWWQQQHLAPSSYSGMSQSYILNHISFTVVTLHKENDDPSTHLSTCVFLLHKKEKAQPNSVNTRDLLLVDWMWLSGAESNWVGHCWNWLLVPPSRLKKQMVFKRL